MSALRVVPIFVFLITSSVRAPSRFAAAACARRRCQHRGAALLPRQSAAARGAALARRDAARARLRAGALQPRLHGVAAARRRHRRRRARVAARVRPMRSPPPSSTRPRAIPISTSRRRCQRCARSSPCRRSIRAADRLARRAARRWSVELPTADCATRTYSLAFAASGALSLTVREACGGAAPCARTPSPAAPVPMATPCAVDRRGLAAVARRRAARARHLPRPRRRARRLLARSRPPTAAARSARSIAACPAPARCWRAGSHASASSSDSRRGS